MSAFVASVTFLALISATFLGAVLVWSIFFPSRRLWPTGRVTPFTQIKIWSPTVAIFAAASLVGIIEWNALDWPGWLRFGVGLPLILAGNLIVWRAVFGIDMDATSGARSHLKTDGLYRYSRNPQYLADMGILIGWAVLSASPSAWIIAAGGFAALALAPFAEEPWLEDVYGEAYRCYRNRVPRFLGWPGWGVPSR
ncbi:isoprenylcysteine carboxylmethyltransferase family protein [Jannaschia sp. S6380]|uniref:methyltransferase family protein n=1 Tax=Jannaschia sp. S6380 TaxID=2926408 RepID=UPI001FF5899D|nr:isoprenylcysteine carboxylmethyltransferase family protein [Jannaschia sp. S6380]